MTSPARTDQYRRHRRSAAARRRSGRLRRPPCRLFPGGEIPVLVGGRHGTGGTVALLRDVVRRAAAYASVRGVLCALENGSLRVRIVAPRPMTKPLQVLAAAWSGEFNAAAPAADWDIRVLSEAPCDAPSWQCLFWRE